MHSMISVVRGRSPNPNNIHTYIISNGIIHIACNLDEYSWVVVDEENNSAATGNLCGAANSFIPTPTPCEHECFLLLIDKEYNNGTTKQETCATTNSFKFFFLLGYGDFNEHEWF